MRKSIKVHLKRRGRPATGKDPLVSARLPRAMIDQVEAWAARNDATRSEAIRSLVELGLATSQPMSRRSPKAAAKASEMAGEQIDKLADSSATDEERHSRKRRLLTGPGEFRDIRGDVAKPKG
jgi:Arc/MetJ-type ribon-helix-helix transcriptional regulator